MPEIRPKDRGADAKSPKQPPRFPHAALAHPPVAHVPKAGHPILRPMGKGAATPPMAPQSHIGDVPRIRSTDFPRPVGGKSPPAQRGVPPIAAGDGGTPLSIAAGATPPDSAKAAEVGKKHPPDGLKKLKKARVPAANRDDGTLSPAGRSLLKAERDEAGEAGGPAIRTSAPNLRGTLTSKPESGTVPDGSVRERHGDDKKSTGDGMEHKFMTRATSVLSSLGFGTPTYSGETRKRQWCKTKLGRVGVVQLMLQSFAVILYIVALVTPWFSSENVGNTYAGPFDGGTLDDVGVLILFSLFFNLAMAALFFELGMLPERAKVLSVLAGLVAMIFGVGGVAAPAAYYKAYTSEMGVSVCIAAVCLQVVACVLAILRIFRQITRKKKKHKDYEKSRTETQKLGLFGVTYTEPG